MRRRRNVRAAQGRGSNRVHHCHQSQRSPSSEAPREEHHCQARPNSRWESRPAAPPYRQAVVKARCRSSAAPGPGLPHSEGARLPRRPGQHHCTGMAGKKVQGLRCAQQHPPSMASGHGEQANIGRRASRPGAPPAARAGWWRARQAESAWPSKFTDSDIPFTPCGAPPAPNDCRPKVQPRRLHQQP